ncbi:MAG: LuxR C-terminal-related transcriptional regulator [bacterium]
MDYRTILNNAPLPLLIYQDGRFVYCNPAGFELFRYSGYDFDELTLLSVDPWSLVVPEEREEGRKQMREVLEAGLSATNIARTCLDARGHRVETLISVSPSSWEGRPAAEMSYTILGLYSVYHPDSPPSGDHIRTGSRDARRITLEPLTLREKEVAMLVAKGLSTAAILEQLDIKDSTFRSYIKSIYRKTGINSRTELTRLVLGHK